MREMPRLRGLKHIKDVTTKDFADGQTFLDILKVGPQIRFSRLYRTDGCHRKCILPCVVQSLPRNSPFVHCIRAYAKYRLMIGMHCMSEQRFTRLEKYKREYKKWCAVCASEF